MRVLFLLCAVEAIMHIHFQSAEDESGDVNQGHSLQLLVFPENGNVMRVISRISLPRMLSKVGPWLVFYLSPVGLAEYVGNVLMMTGADHLPTFS